MSKSAQKKQAIVLLSGGLDSATTLYLAKDLGYRLLALVFDYGQRHKKEINAARPLARAAGAEYQIIKMPLSAKKSSLLNKGLKVPRRAQKGVPNTYVPARNIVFLSVAVSIAEGRGMDAVFIGANARDFSGYPDCRPEFYRAFKKVVRVGTGGGIKRHPVKIATPLIDKTKAEIVKLAVKLDVPLALTWSCYRGGKVPCGACDSCRLRAKGFREAKIEDPLLK